MSLDAIDYRQAMRDTAREAVDEALRAAELHGQQIELPSFPELARQYGSTVHHYTGCELFRLPSSAEARLWTEAASSAGAVTWAHIMAEELCEAYDEADDTAALRAELVQVAATALRWVAAIDHQAGER